MTTPPKYEDLVLKVAELERCEAAMSEDLKSEKILSKTLQGQRETFMKLSADRSRELREFKAREDALREELEVASRAKGIAVSLSVDAKVERDALKQRLTVAEQRADDMVYALARIQGRAEMFIDDGMHMPTPSIEAIRDIAAKAALKPA